MALRIGTMLLLLWLSATLTAATSNCSFCIREQCYSESNFIPNNFNLYYAVIDHNYNTMYYTSTSNNLNAINLDNMTSFEKNFKDAENRTFLLTVDQNTGDVYGYNVYVKYKYPLIYKYDPKTNTTNRTDMVLHSYLQHTTIHFCNGTVYGINGKYRLFSIKDGCIGQVPGFRDVSQIMDFTCDKSANIYIHTLTDIYRIEANAIKGNISFGNGGEYKIPALGADGNVYLLSDNPGSRLIYYINNNTQQIEQIGAYERSLNIRDWKFDKQGNIFIGNFELRLKPVKYFKPNHIRCNVVVKTPVNVKIITENIN